MVIKTLLVNLIAVLTGMYSTMFIDNPPATAPNGSFYKC